MSNMSYCRFENTLPDLKDCYNNLSDFNSGELSKDEAEYAAKLIRLAHRIAEEYSLEEVDGILNTYKDSK